MLRERAFYWDRKRTKVRLSIFNDGKERDLVPLKSVVAIEEQSLSRG